MKKSFCLLIFAVLLSASLLLGCSESEEAVTDAIDLVPQKANVMGHIELSQIIEDEDIVGVYEALLKEAGDPETVEEALAEALEMTGLDLQDFEQAWVFSYISDDAGQAEYFGAMLRGSFEESDLSADIESAMGERFQTIEYKGLMIYAGTEEYGLAVLASDLVVAGPVEVVKDVIDVREGDEPAVDGQLVEVYGSLGNARVKLAALVPPGLVEEGLQELTTGLPSSPALDALANMQTITMTMTKNGESFAGNVEICFADSSSAEAVEGLIPLLPLMMRAIEIPEESPIQIPPEALTLLPELLGKSAVTTSGSCLRIRVDLTVAEIVGLLAG